MAKESKPRDGRAMQAALREGFRAVEAQPVPVVLTEQVERLAAPKRRPDGRS